MKVIRVATSDSRAYYSILARLKKTRLRFVTSIPSELSKEIGGPVITTRKETDLFNCSTISIEDLNDDPLIMEGQILSRVVAEQRRVLVIGVDPGSRTGIAVYYGDVQLGFRSENSEELVLRDLSAIIRLIPHSRILIRIGDGAPQSSRSLLRRLILEIPNAMIEMVDERGTSARGLRGREKGLTTDQEAAARIAFRKGMVVNRRTGH